MADMINHPPHYNSSGIKCECGRQIECIDVSRHKNFNIGNVMKYIWRYEHKNGAEDLAKAAWYLQDEINRLKKKPENKKPPLLDGLPESTMLLAGLSQMPCKACGQAHAGYTCEEFLTRPMYEHE